MRTPLDIYDEYPYYMKRYLQHYGWNFNKKACLEAIKGMKHENKLSSITDKELVESILKRHGVELENNTGYNAVFVYNMGLHDYLGSSIPDEEHLAYYVKDVIDDEDNRGGNVFRKWYADCIKKGIVIDFEDIL